MTAAISARSSISSTHTDEVDAEPPKPALAPPPKKSDVQANRVESWVGAKTSAPSAEAAVAKIETLMKKNSCAPVRDFFVTERDAREAVSLLSQLPAREFNQALDTMSPIARAQLLSEMDAETRKAFFRQGVQKGAIKEEPGAKAPAREGSPPDKPALLRNEPSLSSEVRVAVLEENRARTAQYMKDFDGYVSRYSEAALKASSPLALRLMGPPVTEFVLREPGRAGNDPTSLEQGSTHRARAARAANDRISDFAGRTRAGTFSATAESKLEIEVFGSGVEASYGAKVSDAGKVSGKLKADAQVGLPHVSLGIGADGKHFQEVGALGVRLRAEDGKLSELETKLKNGLGVMLTAEKTQFAFEKGFATIDEKRGSYGGGVKLGYDREVSGAKLEASLKLGVIVQGVAPERLADIASMKNDGIWGPMPELDARTRWNELPHARRERLARDGWSYVNWPIQ